MDMKTTCLGVLALGDATGYEIKKHFEEGPFSHFADGGFGSIYPALSKLTNEGLVTCEEQAQNKRPAKKVYSITPMGKIALMDALNQPVAEDKYRSDFLFTLFFADYQSANHVEKLIDNRIDAYRRILKDMEQDVCEINAKERGLMGPEFVQGMGFAIYQAALQYLEENKHIAVAAALRGELKDQSKLGTDAAE